MEITGGAFFAAAESGPGEQRVESDSLGSPALRAHFYLAGLARHGGIVVVFLRVANRETVGAAALLAAANFGVLLFVLLRLHAFAPRGRPTLSSPPS